MSSQSMEEIQKIVLGYISELSVCVAPFAVVLVKGSVRLSADVLILGKGHSAALAEKLSRTSEQGVYGYVELTGKDLQGLIVGFCLTGLPAADGLSCNQNSFCELLLGKLVIFTYLLKYFFGSHGVSPLFLMI